MTMHGLVRSGGESVDDGLEWLDLESWPAADLDSDFKRRRAVKRLGFARWRVDNGSMTDHAPAAPPIEDDDDEPSDPRGIGLAVVGTGMLFWAVVVVGIFLP